ncbi:hypothetical protein [Yokenella regensburgei]|uniref:hypothetical protein n=1 Tax=Yokenella regensburgei TaxID=158877 RepID=UPI003CC909E0
MSRLVVVSIEWRPDDKTASAVAGGGRSGAQSTGGCGSAEENRDENAATDDSRAIQLRRST